MTENMPRHDAGSVLMETLFVLPILLMMLGGLFVVCDVIHGRLHLQNVDRISAWSPDSRFEAGSDSNIVSRWSHHIAKHTELVLEKAFTDFYEAGSSGASIVDYWDETSNLTGINLGGSAGGRNPPRSTEWLDFAGGRAYACVKVPIWAAMVNVHSVTTGSSDYLTSDWRLMTYERDVDSGSPDKASHAAGDYKEFNRQYLVRRKHGGYINEDFRRNQDIINIDWFGTALGEWPCSAKRSSAFGFLTSLDMKLRRAFSRHQAALAVGE